MNFIKLTQYGDGSELYVDSDKIQIMIRVKNEYKKADITHEYTNIHMSGPVAPNIYFIHVKETPEEILKQINRYRDEFIGALLGPEPDAPQQDAGYYPCYSPESDSCDKCEDFLMERCPGCDRSCESKKEDEQPDCDPSECYDDCDICYVHQSGACDGCEKRGEDEC